MAKVNLQTIKNWFKTGLKPTQIQFWNVFDSFFHKDEQIPVNAIENLDTILIQKADKQAFESHLNDSNKHITNDERTEWNKEYSLDVNEENGNFELKKGDETSSSIPINSETSFANEEGNVKYSGNTDKRTGYYDEVNQVYYPNIIENSSSYRLLPKTTIITNSSRINYANHIALIKLPNFILNESTIGNGYSAGITLDILGVKIDVRYVFLSNEYEFTALDFIFQNENLHPDIEKNISVVGGVFGSFHQPDRQLFIALRTDNFYVDLTKMNVDSILFTPYIKSSITKPVEFNNVEIDIYNNSDVLPNNFNTVNGNKRNKFQLDVLNKNGAKQFEVTDEIGFCEYFDFNTAEKQVNFKSEKFIELSDRSESDDGAFIFPSFTNQSVNHKVSQSKAFKDVLLRSQKTGKRILELSLFGRATWKNHNNDVNDIPNFITYNLYLKPVGGSFYAMTHEEKVLIASIEVTESDLEILTSFEKSYYNTKVIIRKTNTNFGTMTHSIIIPVKKYDINGNIKSSSTTTVYFYENNSSVRKEIDSSISFHLEGELELNYKGKTTPTPWSVSTSIDAYKVEIIK